MIDSKCPLAKDRRIFKDRQNDDLMFIKSHQIG